MDATTSYLLQLLKNESMMENYTNNDDAHVELGNSDAGPSFAISQNENQAAGERHDAATSRKEKSKRKKMK